MTNRIIRKCSICEDTHYGKGYCIKHYYRFKTYGDPAVEVEKREGNSKHPLYVTWLKMCGRCLNPCEKDAPYYKDRGIGVAPEWLGYHGFKRFVEDMGERPAGMSLDRIDSNKDYSKENCRWATPHQQSANTRRSAKNSSGGIVGVSFVKHRGTWDARIMVNRKIKLLGTYHIMEQAVSARKEAEKHYGIIY